MRGAVWPRDDRRRAGVERRVAGIVERVRTGGDRALRALTRRLDGAGRLSIEVPASERAAGARRVAPDARAALRLAARRIAAFARRQKRSLRPFRHAEGGIILEQRIVPIERAGVYAPGGRHPLASSVLMGALPARIAGCREVILCTPPRRDGTIAPEILAAASEAGVDRIFAVGGAQAIASMAFGTRTIPAVDLIVGPGNRYVAAAKALVSGRVAIDFVAGPTELLVIADRRADAATVASDLLAQAEHDEAARCALIRLGTGAVPGIGSRLGALLERTLPAGSPGRRAAAASLSRLRVIRCASIEAACRAANRLAPEHLSLQVAEPRRFVPRLTNYGSLFLGGGSAVALGDYVTGPSHILPTGGAARQTGGLSVLKFMKVVTVQEVRAGSGAPGRARSARRRPPDAAVARLGAAARRLARLEGLEAHAASIAGRFDRSGPGAILFDFNGVLMDDEEYHWRACAEVAAPLGIRLTRRRYEERYLAFDDRGALRAILADAGRSDGPLDELVRAKRRAFRRLCGSSVRIEPPVAALIRELSSRAPLAIVSGAARDEIARALRRARLVGRFRTIVTSEDVTRCKPDPEGYLLALRRLGAGTGDRCLAVEDSPGGIEAARAAGLTVLGVATSYAPRVLRRSGAARVVARLDDLRPADLLSLAAGSPSGAAPRTGRAPTASGRRRRRRRSSR